MERTITIKELQESKFYTWSVKDNSVRGYTTKYAEDVKQGDKVIIDNYFTLVIKHHRPSRAVYPGRREQDND